MAIRRLLVANRGEIAVRIFRTCRGLGIGTVAVTAPDDRGALHTRSADETVEIASYLHSEEHIRAAKRPAPTRSTRLRLPRRERRLRRGGGRGRAHVGRPAGRSAAAGRRQARREADRREAGVPVVPTGEAAEIGFPLVVKAAAGGGGRGMRVVREPAELDEALAAAAREAEAAFGDGTVFCERYIERPRHVEIQLLADSHGTVLALGERDCSVQRRHQKVLEESPSPALDPELRAAMSAAAVAFARDRIRERRDGRVHARRPRLLLPRAERPDPGRAPRHRARRGLDLVREQIRIAEGEPLEPSNRLLQGHAVEVRLYAEDPRTFLPQAGTLERLRLPTGVRVDAGVAEGDEVGLGYDPMIAKLIAHGPTRDEAFARLGDALAETEVGGVTTNLPFLRWLVAHPVVRAGEATTAFLTEYPPLSEPPLRLPDAAWRAAAAESAPAPPAAAAPCRQRRARSRRRAAARAVTAPMPGTVIQVLVSAGDQVEARRPLLVLEAMKMETPLAAPYDATKAVHVAEGDRVRAAPSSSNWRPTSASAWSTS